MKQTNASLKEYADNEPGVDLAAGYLLYSLGWDTIHFTTIGYKQNTKNTRQNTVILTTLLIQGDFFKGHL